MTEISGRDAPHKTLAVQKHSGVRLSRSPRPYRRRRSDASHLGASTLNEVGNEWSSNTSSEEEGGPTSRQEQSLSSTQWSRISSGNATESETESSHRLKALPAPLYKPRKGLITGEEVSGDATPAVTPSHIEEFESHDQSQYFDPVPNGIHTARDVLRIKVEKRRNAEILRRSSEVVFMASVFIATIWPSSSGVVMLLPVRAALLSSFMVCILLIGLYPIRLISLPLLRDGIIRVGQVRIPAKFDPAPIIYPVVIPCLVAVALRGSNPDVVLLNVVLGLSSLPAELIPRVGGQAGAHSLLWLLSVLPVVAFERTSWPSKEFPSKPYKLYAPRVSPEELTMVFSLHQALLQPLGYLTSSSLLPSELHLLSVSLINLMLFSQSPQSKILSYVIWIGGTGLLIFCSAIVERNIALERTPTFLFDSPMERPSESSPSSPLKTSHTIGSIANTARPTASALHRRALTLVDDAVSSASSASKTKADPAALNARQRAGHEQQVASPLRRRQTFSAQDSLERTPAKRPKLESTPSLKTFLADPKRSLTKTEADLWKWAYSIYTYVAMICLVLGPIRHLVGKFALDGQEAVGWALSYLFSGSHWFRGEVLHLDVGDWVHIPREYCRGISVHGLAQSLRCHYGEANTRLAVAVYLLGIVCAGLAVVLILGAVAEVDTRRKVFHGMMVVMILPTAYVDPAFLALALGLVLAIFLLLDIIRAGQLRPLSRPIARFLAPYVDGRDLCGPVIVSHIFLLIGCAIPLWLSLAAIERAGEYPWRGWELQTRDVSMVTGVICVGMGDAAASLVGRRIGRHKWPWAGGKSLEGSAAFAVAVTAGLLLAQAWLHVGGWPKTHKGDEPIFAMTLKCIAAASGASFTEAVLTGCNDNVVVPVILWLLVKAFQI